MKAKFSFKSLIAMAIGLLVSVSVYAQEIVVTGSVLDDLGEPVIGANVIVKGTSNGATTDFDGNFSFKAPAGSTLVVSFVGYTTQEVAAAPNVKIVLKEDSELLEDVVVIGYGVARKNDLTGSVTAVKPDEKNKGFVTSAQDMMQGKIAGVNVVSDGGTPGGGATIRIRGGSSLNASNNPLIVIDGLAMDNQGIKGAPNALSMVNPNDIESFTVLKDASATAIYGSRGSNGVIIITTKKGRGNQKPQVSYNGNVSLSWVTKTMDVLDGDEYRSFVESYYGKDSEAYSFLGTANTDWQKEIYRTAVSHDHNVTVTGGYKNVPYRLSVGYTDQQGVLKTSDYKRTTASLNVNPSFLEDHLKVTFNGKFMYSKTQYAETGAIGNAVRFDPTQDPYSYTSKYHEKFFNEQDASLTDEIKNKYYGGRNTRGQFMHNNGGYFMWAKEGSALDDPAYPFTQNNNATSNPIALLNGKDDTAGSRSVQGNLELDYKVHGFEDLRLHANYAIDYGYGKQDTYIQPWSPSNYYYGSNSTSNESKYNMTFSAYAQYMKDFNKANHFDIMLGYEWSHMKYWGDNSYYGMYQKTHNKHANEQYQAGNGEWKQESFLVSFFGRANYSLLDRYLLTVTVREDGSSRFKDHWALFPSVALGWKIKDESFLRDVDWLNEAKVRLGWGMTGQQDGIGNYTYFASYNVNKNNVDGRYPIVGVNPTGLMYRPDAYNSSLKWETTTTTNVGLDFGFMNDRVTLSADWYYRKTTDLINTADVSAGSNFRNQVTSNIGSLSNTGVEISSTIRPIQTKNWNWEVNLNATYNKNKIIELTGESSIVKNGGISAGTGNTVKAYCAGQNASAFYVYQQVYDEAGKPIENMYVDRNGDGQISEKDLYFYKQSTAPWTAGFSSRLSYKTWDLGFSLRASFDNYVYSDSGEASFSNIEKRYDSSFAYLQNVTKEALNRGWVTYDGVISDYFIHNASFLKCDNITLGYSFDNLFRTNSYKGIGGRVYVTASNVFTITKYDGLDPEVNGGIDNNMYPRPFSMQVGLSLNF